MKFFHLNKISSLFLFFIFFSLLQMCSKQKPTAVDGVIRARFLVVDTTGTIVSGSLSKVVAVPGARIRMYSIDYAAPLRYETDENGFFEAKNIHAGRYRISADKFVPSDSMLNLGKKGMDVMLSGSTEIDLYEIQQDQNYFLIEVAASFLSSIVINEIYYAGPPGVGNYWFDQFIELYNASDTTQYLDQMLICRLKEEQEMPGMLEASLYYQFPGSGFDYPIEPGEFKVIAQDAINHITDANISTSIDLSMADWEFFNQYVPDLDNPNVPNLLNASGMSGAWDFFMGIQEDEICLVHVYDLESIPFYNETTHRLFSIFDLIDAVEYSTQADHIKAYDSRIDAGLAGLTVHAYSGKSIERHHPETGGPGYDTNNSTFDFVSLYHPTPGWQHSAQDVITGK